MSLDYFRVVLTIGDGFTVEEDSRVAPDPWDAAWVLDGLRHGWTAEDPTTTALRPAPTVVSFDLLTEHRDNVPDFNVGDIVVLRLYLHDDRNPDGEFPALGFAGRLTDLEAAAYGDRGLAYRMTAVDFTADLAEEFVGDEPWPQEFSSNRFDRIEALALAKGIQINNLPTGAYTAATFRARDIDRRSVREALQSHLDQLPAQEYMTYAYDPGTGTLAYYYVSARTSSSVLDIGVLELLEVQSEPRVVTLYAPVNPANWEGAGWMVYNRTVHASQVQLGATWRKDKTTSVTRVLVSGEFSDGTTTAEASNPGPAKITQRVDVDVLESGVALELAESLLPEPAPAQRWNLESYTILVEELEDVRQVIAPYLLSSHLAYGYVPDHPVGTPRVVGDIHDPINLGGRRFYAGQVTGVEVEIRGGRIRIQVAQRPTVPQAGYSYVWPALTPASLLASAEFGDLTPADLDPILTAYDFRLAGQSSL